MTVLSLGAGVQSTTLVLLALDGVLALPNCAVFADTGCEPAAVYTHLDRLAQRSRPRASRCTASATATLRADSLDPDRCSPYGCRSGLPVLHE